MVHARVSLTHAPLSMWYEESQLTGVQVPKALPVQVWLPVPLEMVQLRVSFTQLPDSTW